MEKTVRGFMRIIQYIKRKGWLGMLLNLFAKKDIPRRKKKNGRK
jgi:hypothetical protein